MFLIAGLGNPGPQYARTRHNAGWFVVDELARRHAIDLSRKSFDARIGSGVIGEHRVLLAEPLTFMNLSGRAVGALLRYHNIDRSRLLVICDDLNLPLGKIRLRAAGSDGGHNGLKSIQQALASKEYPRLRFGVSAPPAEEREERGTRDYVLNAFAPDEWPTVEATVARAADCVETFIRSGALLAMTQFNG